MGFSPELNRPIKPGRRARFPLVHREVPDQDPRGGGIPLRLVVCSHHSVGGTARDDDTLAFLEKWVEDNTSAVPAELRAQKAESLAEQCLRDAAEAGFSEDDVAEAASELSDGDDLAAYIEQALEKASDEEDEFEDEDA
jgi:hypothetical protein